LLWDTVLRRTFPGPTVSFGAKPSASSPSERAVGGH
jgi:hypothetical protein